jgi:hypothetical protein
VLLVAQLSAAAVLGADIQPRTVNATIFPGGSVDIQKTVTTPELPPVVDVCLLEDETGSFGDDILNLNTAASGIYDAVVAASPDAQFAVAGFRDYPVSPYGNSGDWVYRLISSMNPAKPAWLAGVALLTAGGGNDFPEAQYDAIVAASGPGSFTDPTLGAQADCGWRAPSTGAQRVLVVATDATFHIPPGPHVNTQATTIAALAAQDIIVIGLKAPGAGAELDALAAATGGSVQALTSNGSNIAAAILAGLAAVEVDVTMESTCEWPISTTFDPVSRTVVSGANAVFTETIAVAADAPGGTYTCRDVARINGELLRDDAGAVISEVKTIKVPEGFLTGGGQILKDGAGVSFGGNVGYLADFSIVGQWRVNDTATKLIMHSTSIDSLQFTMADGEGPYPPDANANVALFSGTARVKVGNAKWVETCTFTAYARDQGEPAFAGDPDGFGIRIVCGANVYTYGRAPLDTGNLQIHSGVKY